MQEPLTRGRKSKAKCAKEKYADQDEAERLLALDFLGSAGGILITLIIVLSSLTALAACV